MPGSSPENSAGTVSTARARPSVRASMTTEPGRKVSSTGLARSATSETRRTASANAAPGTSARQPNSAGNRDRYRMNSPPISRAVSRRPPIPKLIMPSAGRGSAAPRPPRGADPPADRPSGPPAASSGPVSKATDTGIPGVIARAASARVRAGTSAAARSPGRAAAQGISRTASRYRSVAASVSVPPSMSRQTPVSMGSVSSRLAAGATWPMAGPSTPPSMVPARGGGAGSAGYSSAASAYRVNSALPQVRLTASATAATSTASAGRLRVISVSSRPGTITVPGSATSASICAVADTS